MGWLSNPHVYPCREAVTETAKGLRADVRGDGNAAKRHYGRADAAQRTAVKRGTNKKG